MTLLNQESRTSAKIQLKKSHQIIRRTDDQLSCHKVYDKVASSHLSHNLNNFEFECHEDMLKYLVAITPVRANAIRSVISISSCTRGSDQASLSRHMWGLRTPYLPINHPWWPS